MRSCAAIPAAAVAAAIALPAPGGGGAARAQVAPHAEWRTIRTAHFDVHFTPELEEPARRAAANAEAAYAELSRALVPPRGRIDVVVADNVDFTNGFATPFPSNRVVVYASPPVSVPSLRFYDDWNALVIVHELAHIFHLDRARGWWRLGQRVFGRNPLLMPNMYAPAWVTEGLATFYESELTEAGRVRGSHQRMVLRSSLLEGGLPRLDQWSLATSRYPGGESAYTYGSLFLAYLARTRGVERVRAFVEETSRRPIPFTLNGAARASFGISFEAAWREWRRALRDSAGEGRAPLRGWRELTREGRAAFHPRWLDTTAILYAANTGRETPAAYRVGLDGRVRRVGRRNGVDVNAPLPDGTVLFAQLEFLDPYHMRSDLFVQRGRAQRRLTRGARLGEPDARADGEIVAVQAIPATTRLVRVSADGRRVTPLTPASPDTQWAEPRWSPRGDRIAAIRWARGGYADVVVLDTAGAVLVEITRDRATESAPSWTPDGRAVVFVSDRTGTSDLYLAQLDCAPVPPCAAPTGGSPNAGSPNGAIGSAGGGRGAGEPLRLSRAATGLFYPALRRDAALLAAVHYRHDGWHVGVAPFDTSGADTTSLLAARRTEPLGAVARADAPARRYSPWRSLLPRYWFPLVGGGPGDGVAVGGLTSGVDVVGRHSYQMLALVNTRTGEVEAGAGYRYSGLGQPIVGLDVEQIWDRARFEADTTLVRRTRSAAITATALRPRARTNAFLTAGGEVERRDYHSEPREFLARRTLADGAHPTYFAALAAAGWSNAQRPTLSISPEDGVALAAAGRQRWLEGRGLRSRSVSATLAAYKSLPGGRFAHNVVAGRVAAGVATGDDPGEFEVGGSSGSAVALLPGVGLGGRRTFAVRGFPAASVTGTRALAASLELRLPLAVPSRGLGLWPVFLDRVSFSAFADAGRAWTPAIPGSRRDIASVGGELNFDAALQYDAPYRVRLGLAAPVAGRRLVGVRPVSAYLTAGLAF